MSSIFNKTLALNLWLCLLGPAFAASKPADLESSGLELLAAIEKADPTTQTHKEAWLPIKTALLAASQEVESLPGLTLSFSRILENWGGKSFHLLSPTDAQYWALQQTEQPYPDSGAWFQARGSKWTVQYVGLRGLKLFRRGDFVKTPDFDPILSSENKSGVLAIEVQNSPMSPLRKISSKIQLNPFSNYVLAETQHSATVLTLAKKRSCQQKLWFWMSPAVGAQVLSKLNYHSENCNAQLLDLRDAFGPELESPLKLAKKIPTVVLINRETREGAVRLAWQLQKEGARIIGEPSGNPLLPEQQIILSKPPLTVLVYGANAEGIQPDQRVKDSLVYAEGLDEVYEAGINWIKMQIK